MFRKPKVAPPSNLPDPDLSSIEPIVLQYTEILEEMLASGSIRNSVLMKYRKAIDDVILISFNSISFFMDNEVYRHSEKLKKNLHNAVSIASSLATSGSWAIGRHWGLLDFSLRSRLKSMDAIDTDDVPADAMILLNDAGYYPY